MANEQNLKPSEYKLSREEAKKGGINSGIARRRKASVREIFQQLLNSNLTDRDKANLLKQFSELTDENISYKTAIGIKQLDKAVKGDIVAAKFMFDYAGEKPVEEMSVETKLPVFNIQVTDNKELEEEFEKYETNTETD